MSDIERFERAAGLRPLGSGRSQTSAPNWQAPRRRLSRAWFDVIILILGSAIVSGFYLVKLWSTGCAAVDVKDRGASIIRSQMGASNVTLHLIEKVWRKPGSVGCTALARIEFADKPTARRQADYVVFLGHDGGLAGVDVRLRSSDR